MCGIAGIYDYSRPYDAVDVAVLGRMLDAIRHRGPDDEGRYTSGNLALGMRRLSIIDVSGGRQPMTNEDGSVVVVFNGEIYNFRALVDDLIKRGHVFKTECDTEVLTHLYEECGAEMVTRLRGMFAFALWDANARRLLIARDHLGVKPVYYLQRDGRLIFGSEIKAILAHPYARERAALNPEALSEFLSLRYVPAPQTMFEGIFALPPGHLLTCDANGITVRRYWDISYQTDEPPHSEAYYAERLESLLDEAVRMQLMSDVPFGAFLSGGIDSSTIVALMSRHLNAPVKTFSSGFAGDGGEEVSELPYARMVAQQYSTDHYEVMLTARDLIDLSEKIVWHLDQPIGDQATVANYLVARLASQHVKMVLTGEGGDELFAGYARYAGERFAPAFQTIPAPLRNAALSTVGRIPGLRKVKLGLYALNQADEAARLCNWFPLFNRSQKDALLADNLLLSADCAEVVIADHLRRTDAKDALSRMLYVDSKLWLPDDLLARGDKTSMAVSLEARVPLLDHKLVEFAATVPPHFKVRGMTRKYLLKRVGAKLLPEAIIRRKKQGFPMPISQWFRGEANAFLRDHLSSQTFRQRGLFNQGYVERLLSEHELGFADHGLLLWGLLNVELWHRLYLDREARALMKVLMLLENNPYPQDSRVQKEAATLSGAGYDVTVICPRSKGQRLHERVGGVRVYRFPTAKSGDGLRGYALEYGWSMLAFGLLSLWVMVRHGFDVIHAHNPPDMIVLLALVYKCLGKHFVFDHHDLSPEMYYARFGGEGSRTVYRVLLLLEWFSCRMADQVIATNQSYKNVEMARDGVSESRITIVRNAPVIGRDEPASAPVEIDAPGKLLIGYIGVIGYQDGVDNLLHALCHLRTGLGRRDFLCLIMGDGDALADVKALAADLRLDDCVRFLGWIPQQQVAGYLKAVDICAAPEPLNEYNDLSTVIKITEYMAAAKPVVAFALTEHRVTADEAALYATPNDSRDFACKLSELMDNSERRALMGRYGRQRIEQSLGWAHQEEKLLGVYARLSAGRVS